MNGLDEKIELRLSNKICCKENRKIIFVENKY